ncbi:MAG: UvrD-helicase domain-containing protein, partial [Helicobacter sp.]|nr:UvrD-helicase domain-containing protein [Helicobacter sp.]
MLGYRPLVGLEASAGSGKTFALSVHFVYLLLTDPSLRANEILALTFTKKAAKEMRQKIMQALFLLSHDSMNLAHKPELSEQREIFLNALSDYANESAGKVAHKSKGLYARALAHKPSIMTLDAFFMSVLKKFCWYAGVPSDFEIDELQNRDKLYERFLERLDDSARQALAHLCLQNQWFGIKDCQIFFEHLVEHRREKPQVCSPHP